jgi:DNA mismatch endonuclease, patch repair protein
MTDNLTLEQTSYAMFRVNGRDTGPERPLQSAFDGLGMPCITYPKDLHGKPDIIFPESKVAVFFV